MRLLCIGNRYPPHGLGGYERLWQSAVEHLRQHGHNVVVLTSDAREPDQAQATDEPFVHRELRWYWRDHAFPRMGPLARLQLERQNAATLDAHLAEKPDVVCWWAMGGMSLSLVERVRRLAMPAVGVVGDDWLRYGPRFDAWTRGWRRLAFKPGSFAGIPTDVALRSAARWVFISEEMRTMARRDGLHLVESDVLHPGVDPVRFSKRLAGPWRWRLLYCGRIDPRKGIRTAIEALDRLPVQAALTIDGSGDLDHAEELVARAHDLGLRGRMTMRCSRPEDVPAAYGAADAVLFPVEWREPWGLVPLEAMAVGRPVVATGRGGSAEYLEHGVNCLLFDSGDAEGLAEAVRTLASDPELRNRLREGGFATAARYSERGFNQGLEQVLLRAADR